MEKDKKKLTPQEMEERLIEFASRVIDLAEALPKTAAANISAVKSCVRELHQH